MMTGKQRIEAVLRGERPDRVPVMLHNFLMAAREAGYTQRQYREDPRTSRSPHPGRRDVRLRWRRGRCRHGHAGRRRRRAGGLSRRRTGPLHGRLPVGLARISDLPPPDIGRHQRIQIWLEAVRLLKPDFGDEIYLRGNCDQCPFSLAGLMRGAAEWMMDLMDEEQPPRPFALLDYCQEATAQFLRLMATTGADMLSNGDSPAGPDVVSPAHVPPVCPALGAADGRPAHAVGRPYLLHICGNTTAILDDISPPAPTPWNWTTRPTPACSRRTESRAVFIGNIDPSGVLALGTPALVEQRRENCWRTFSDSPRFILNAGCAIPPRRRPKTCGP